MVPQDIGTSDKPVIEFWDASQGLALNGSNVRSWTGQILGIVASQATPANQPLKTTLNGQVAIDFDGSSQNLSFNASSFPTGSAAWGVAFGGLVRSTAAYPQLLSYGAANTNQLRSVGARNGNFGAFYYSNDFVTAITATDADHFAYHDVAAGASPASFFYVDGVTPGTSSPRGTLSTPTGTTGRIGCGPTGADSMTMIAQRIYVLSRPLTTTERQQLEGIDSWARGRNGANLPANHPYKAAAPTVTTADPVLLRRRVSQLICS
jgi:hypothetical protein